MVCLLKEREDKGEGKALPTEGCSTIFEATSAADVNGRTASRRHGSGALQMATSGVSVLRDKLEVK